MRVQNGLRFLFGACTTKIGTTVRCACLTAHTAMIGAPMAQTAREIFVVGLRNAHAMETQARELMESQSERLDEYPEVKAKVTAHLQETNEQLKRLEQCLETLGEITWAV